MLSVTARSDLYLLLGFYTALFVIYSLSFREMKMLSPGWLIGLVLLTRAPFFFSLPLLSDDFYRFLWDGLLLIEGANPYTALPSSIALSTFENPQFASYILEHMNSPDYMSVYPPFHQAVFAFGAFLSKNAGDAMHSNLLAGVNGMRLAIVCAEILSIFYFFKHSKGIFVLLPAYLLNPLVVVEGTGNLHLEAMMAPMLIAGLHAVFAQNHAKAGILYAGAVLTKLTPLFIAPALLFRLHRNQFWKFAVPGLLLVVLAILWFEPWTFTGDTAAGFQLYFNRFEFNAPLYYGLKALLLFGAGYQAATLTSTALALCSVVIIVWVSIRHRKADIFELALVVYLIYYLFTTTVHPWYIIPIVFLAIVSGRYLLLVWSFTVWFSYAHYIEPTGPSYLLIALEYALLGAAVLIESRRKRWLENEDAIKENYSY